jgi:hypothetical protein
MPTALEALSPCFATLCTPIAGSVGRWGSVLIYGVYGLGWSKVLLHAHVTGSIMAPAMSSPLPVYSIRMPALACFAWQDSVVRATLGQCEKLWRVTSNNEAPKSNWCVLRVGCWVLTRCRILTWGGVVLGACSAETVSAGLRLSRMFPFAQLIGPYCAVSTGALPYLVSHPLFLQGCCFSTSVLWLYYLLLVAVDWQSLY